MVSLGGKKCRGVHFFEPQVPPGICELFQKTFLFWDRYNGLSYHDPNIHPGRWTAGTWEYTPWKRKIIFQTIIFRFYVILQGCNPLHTANNCCFGHCSVEVEVASEHSVIYRMSFSISTNVVGEICLLEGFPDHHQQTEISSPPKKNIHIHSLKLTARPWKLMVGRWNLLLELPIVRSDMLVLGRGISSKHNSGHHDLRPLLLDQGGCWLYTGWWLNQPHLKKMRPSKWVHLPQVLRGENKKYLSCHHLVY